MLKEETDLLNRQMAYLQEDYALCELFDRMEVPVAFVLADSHLQVGLDNITFGPEHPRIRIPDNHSPRAKIICFSLLYALVWNHSRGSPSKIENQLINFIAAHNLSFSQDNVMMRDEEVKTYLVKFLFGLVRDKCCPRTITEELATLPSIIPLLLHLLQTLTDCSELEVSIYGHQIQANLKKEIDFSIELLTDQYFIVEEEFLVEIETDPQGVVFTLRAETKETLERIREESGLRRTACFAFQQISLMDLTVYQKTVLSTVKSIGLPENTSSEQEETKYIEQIASKGKCITQVEVEDDVLQLARLEFAALINSHHHSDEEPQSLQTSMMGPSKHRRDKHHSVLIDFQMEQFRTVQQSQESDPWKPRTALRERKNKCAQSSIVASKATFEFKRIFSCQQQPVLKSKRQAEDSLAPKSERVPAFIKNRERAKVRHELPRSGPKQFLHPARGPFTVSHP